MRGLNHRAHAMNPLAEKHIGRRTRNLFDPASAEPFKLSRSKIELFRQCPLCFYLDRRLGIGRVAGPAFTLNSAVDALLKKEFDGYRARGEPHPLMIANNINAIPFAHPQLDVWRENFKGVQHLHVPTNLLITGVVDDLWIEPQGTVFVVDYKSTSTEKAISLEDEWKQAYKRQMEVYQWLLRRNGLVVSDTGYFVYVNAGKDGDSFDGRLEFSAQVIPYSGNDDWIEQAFFDARACLVSEASPSAAAACPWCAYREASSDAIN